MDFDEKNERDWIEIQSKLFPGELPQRFEWKDRLDIVKVLKTIGSIDNSNHLFFPTGGGLDVHDANISAENDCIEIDTGGLIDIVKPSRLIFNSFNAAPEWNYFRLETHELKPSGTYPEAEGSDEELTELEPGNYISRKYLEMGEYNGKRLPPTTRVVTRHFHGAFVIFQKTSIYNRDSRTYDGRHNTMTDEEFRSYIQRQIDHPRK